MRLALITAGEFVMGSPETELNEKGEHAVDEQPHPVRITRPCYLGVYEVTQAEYREVMGSNPSDFSPTGKLKDNVAQLDADRLPVENVSFEDAQAFCARLSRIEGKKYRLPTAAYGEYACRAGTTGPFSFGASCDGSEANCDGNKPYGTTTGAPSLVRPTTVGSYRANAFGLYDMHGNVAEWCSDWYGAAYYPAAPLEDPERGLPAVRFA